MNCQKEIGSLLRTKIGKKLGFEKNEIQNFLKATNQTNTSDTDYKSLDLDSFQIVSEPHHYAILEYFKLNDMSSKPADIASQLSLKVSVVNDSLRRLNEVGLLKKIENGFTPTNSSNSSILKIGTSKAHREQQCQILETAIHALTSIPIELRSQSSMTMAIDSKRLNEAKELIKNFRRDMGRFLSNSDQLDSVYQLSISLYPLTITKKTTNQKEK